MSAEHRNSVLSNSSGMNSFRHNPESSPTNRLKFTKLKTDSPLVIEACRDLGYKVEDLNMKSLDSFKDSQNTKIEMIQIRYNYYLKRHNKMVSDIRERIKQILRRNRARSQELNSPGSYQGSSPLNISPMNSRTNIDINHSDRSFRTTHDSDGKFVSSKYNVALKALKGALIVPGETSLPTAHKAKFIKLYPQAEDSIILNTEGGGFFEDHINEEVNNLKQFREKQKNDVKEFLELELKNLKQTEDWNKKTEKMAINKLRTQYSEFLKKEKSKEAFNEKIEHIKENEKSIKKSMRDRMKKLKEKEKKKQVFLEKYMVTRQEFFNKKISENNSKIQKAQEKKRALSEQSEKNLLENFNITDDLSFQKNSNFESVMTRKSVYLQDQMRKIQDSIDAANSKRKEYDDKHTQEMIDKIVYKQSKIKFFRNKSEKILREKVALSKERLDKFREKKKETQEQKEEQKNRWEDKYKKVTESLETKKLEIEKKIQMKREIQKLKEDNHNFFKLKAERMMENKFQVLQQRNREEKDRIEARRLEDEFLIKTKREAAIQKQLAKEKFSNTITDLSFMISFAGKGKVDGEKLKKKMRNLLSDSEINDIVPKELLAPPPKLVKDNFNQSFS